MTTAPLARHLRRNAAAYGALLLGLLMTAGVLAWLQASLVEKRNRRFEEAVREGQGALEQRMDLYVAMLLGTRGLFWGSSGPVTGAEFHGYVESLEVGLRYPGIQGIGWAVWLAPEQLRPFEERVREDEGPADFRVWPVGARDAYSAIVFLEPLDARNRRAIGFDMFSEPTRREAMARAMLTGQAAMSQTVRLVQEGGGPPQNGFLVYVPVYRTRTLPLTPEGRRAALRGWVYAPFRMGDLMRGVLPRGLEARVDLHVFQGADGARPGALLYGPSPLPGPGVRGLRAEVPLQAAGGTWTLVFTARDAFLDGSERLGPLYALVAGTLLSVLLFFITRAEVNARAQAERASRVHARLAERAQAAVRVRDDFLSVAAHELKTPLTSLHLQLSLLRRAALEADGDPAATRERLLRATEGLERQAGRLAQLVDRLLDLSRVTSGRLSLELEDLDLAQLVRELVDHFTPEAARAGVTLAVEGPAALPVRSDRLRLEQVLSNLVTNALKYGAGQPVTVRLAAHGGDAVSVEVQDRGIGIAPEDVTRVFERFERAVSSRHYGGLGLGLYITRQTAEALGGHVELESTPGEGSTFRVLLPRTGPALDLRPSPAQPGDEAPH